MPETRYKDYIKLKIVSDGTRSGTHLIDTETGETMANVMEVTWKMSAEGACEARVVLLIPKAQIEVDGSFYAMFSGQIDGVLLPWKENRWQLMPGG